MVFYLLLVLSRYNKCNTNDRCGHTYTGSQISPRSLVGVEILWSLTLSFAFASSEYNTNIRCGDTYMGSHISPRSLVGVEIVWSFTFNLSYKVKMSTIRII